MKRELVIKKNGIFLEKREVEVGLGCRLSELAAQYDDDEQFPILIVGTPHKNAPLAREIGKDWDYINFYTAQHIEGYRALERAILMVYLRAAYEICGEQSKITIENSLDKGVFSKLEPYVGWLDEARVEEIKERMNEIIAADEPFVKYVADIEDEEVNIHPEYIRNKAERWAVSEINMYRIGWMGDYCLDDLPPSTGCIKVFDLKYIDKGILIRTPMATNPSQLPVFKHDKMMSETYAETDRWLKLIGVPTVYHLNKSIERGKYRRVIQVSEGLQEKKISQIANTIAETGKRIVLIAGPSSSGKTSFAQRLSVQLNVNGIRTCTLSTDDYFIDREFVKKDEDGNYLFEDLEAVDVELFNKDLNDLLGGKKVDIPVYDFLSGKKVFGTRMTTLSADETIIIEGIHGLNEALTPGIRSRDKFKIYISPLTSLAINEHTRIYSSDARLFRRLVRDCHTRGKSASDTIGSWPIVRAGEEKNIFPFQEEADEMFNSALPYELSALKKYARPVLEEVKPGDENYSEALRLLKLLDFFCEIPDESTILNNSLLREFIGGTCLF